MTSSSNSGEPWFHPLIARADPRVTRRRLLLLSGSGLALAGSVRPDLRLVVAQTPEATPDALATSIQDQITGDEDAVALLRESAAAMADLESFRFEIDTIRGESTIFQGLSVGLIEGAVRRPYDFTATVTVGLPIGTLDVTAIGLDGAAWVEDPLNDGEWIALEGGEEIVALVNPDTLILSSIGLIQDATIDGTEQVDGEETTVVAGFVDFAATAEQLSGGAVTLPTEVSEEPLPVLIWINADRRVVEIEVPGPILTSESGDVVRAIRFFEFNEPVEIEQPEI
ncbi:MAG: LppX_LprAFG lipoprotein [Chloroflexota bacterium]|nr:LppX_LprAFG lipoprotein [Chloroflexota bacterium]